LPEVHLLQTEKGHLFTGRRGCDRAITTQQSARLVGKWIAKVLPPKPTRHLGGGGGRTLWLSHHRLHARHRIAETKHARGKGVVILGLNQPLGVRRADCA